MEQNQTDNTRSLFLALTGKPNVGKSTLLNALLGEKLAIVSPRPQTTRNTIMGVRTEGDVQLVFFDTPGVHKPRTKLGENMEQAVRQSLSDVDLAVMLFAPAGPLGEEEREVIDRLLAAKIKSFAVINKVDTVDNKDLLLIRAKELSDTGAFAEIYFISAKTGEGVEELLAAIEAEAKPGPHFYDAETFTDMQQKTIASELVREQLLYHLREEIPHGTAVLIDEFLEKENGGLKITATILCEKESHKGMIIGKNGDMLKSISTAARKGMEEFFGARVNLRCWVKVRENWRDNPGILRELGYENRR